MYWNGIIWYLSWPALIAANYFIIWFIIKKRDPGKSS